MTPLYGYNNEESAYLVLDYPCGFRARCQIRYWLEFKESKGFRFVSQTLNPKTNVWNKPKTGTYVILAACLYLDEQQHVHCASVSEYTDAVAVLNFIQSFPQADLNRLMIWVLAKQRVVQSISEGKAVWSIAGVPQMPNEQEIETAKVELTTLAQCRALL